MTIEKRSNGRAGFLSVLVIIGCNSLVFQSLLLREFFSVFHDNELVLGIFLAFWLLWPAVGSWGLGRLIPALKNKTTALSLTQITLFFLIPVLVVLVRGTRFFLGIAPGEEVAVVQIFYWLLLVTLPFGVLHGFQFALVSTVYSRSIGDSTKGISRTYIVDTLGGLVGGAVFAYVLVNIFLPFQIVLIMMSLVVVSLFLMAAALPGNRRWLPGYVLLVIPLVLFAVQVKSIERFTTFLGWNQFTLLRTASSQYGRYTITKSENLYSFFQNGGWVYSYPFRLPAEEAVHFTLVQIPSPQQVLVLGIDPQIVTEVLKYPVRRVYWVLLDRLAVDLTKVFVTTSDEAAIHDPRVTIVYTDSRLFIKCYQGPKFDAVIVAIGNPTTLTTNRFYTEEFFREVRTIIQSDGVVFLKLASGENYLSDDKRGFNGSIYFALLRSFPHVLLLPGEELYLIGSQNGSYLSENPLLLTERLKTAGVKTDFLDEGYIAYRFDRTRMTWIKSQLAAVESIKINQDDRPVSTYYYLTLWGAQSSQWLKGVFRSVSRIRFVWLPAAFFVIAVIAAALKIKKTRMVPVAVFVAGMTGMALEIVLILSFQTIFGYVYNLLGVVIAAFMAGILAGSFGFGRWSRTIHNPVRLLGLMMLGSGLYASLMPFVLSAIRLISTAVGAGLITRGLFPILNAIAGFFIGVIFPLANHIYLKTGRPVAPVTGMLYGLDLSGGMVGAFLTSIFLLPLFGTAQTCIVLVIMNMAIVFLLAVGR